MLYQVFGLDITRQCSLLRNLNLVSFFLLFYEKMDFLSSSYQNVGGRDCLLGM